MTGRPLALSLLFFAAACNTLDRDEDGFDALTGDCDDADPDVHPAAIEACDGIDNDCNGEIDELGAKGGLIFYVDLDGDGHGSENATLEACHLPQGYSTSKRDCDESDPAVNPDADEVCDGIDNDCDTHIDEYTAIDAQVWHPDRDGDGFGDQLTEILGCEAPPDHVLDGTDCDDIDPGVNPDALEDCATPFDDDCDGDLNDPDAFACTDFYADLDGDGYGGSSQCLCTADALYAYETGGDCDDNNAAVNPGAEEIVDFLDNDCRDGAPFPMADADVHLQLSHKGIYASQVGGGDFNGDGHADLWVSDENTNTVHLLTDPTFANPWIADSEVAIAGTEEANIARYSIVGLDGNTDGIDDVIVSHPTSDGMGTVHLVFQAPFTGALELSDAATAIDTDVSILGQAMFSAGDLNGDGFADLVLTDPTYDAVLSGTIGQTENAGQIAVFYAPLTGNLSLDDADVVIHGETEGDYLGWDGVGADFDGDGVNGLILSSQGTHHSTLKGDLRIYNDLPGAQWDTTPDSILSSNAFFVYIGVEVGGAGDFNGDGYPDVLLSTKQTTYTTARAMALYGPFPEGETEVGDLPSTVLHRETPTGQPSAVQTVGDVTGDGLEDFLVGDYYDGGSGYGAVYLLQNPPLGHIDLPEHAVKFSTDRAIYSKMGSFHTSSGHRYYSRMMSPGDINGDGVNDLVLAGRQEGLEDASDYTHLNILWGMTP